MDLSTIPSYDKLTNPASRIAGLMTPNAVADLIDYKISRIPASTGVGYITGTGTTNSLPKFVGAEAIGDSLITETGGELVYSGDINMFNSLLAPKDITGIDSIQFKDNRTVDDDQAYSTFRVGDFVNAQVKFQARVVDSALWTTFMEMTSEDASPGPSLEILLGNLSANTTYNGAAWASTFLSATSHYNVNYSKKYNSNTAQINSWDGSSAFAGAFFGTTFEFMLHHSTEPAQDTTYMDFYDPVTWRYNAGGSAPYYDGTKTIKIEISENEIDFVNGMIPKISGTAIVALSSPVSVAEGGTGRSTLTSGYFLRGNGTGAITMTATPITVPLGGTGATTYATNNILLGAGAAAITSVGQNTAFNKSFGTSAGNVSEGNHNHDLAYVNVSGDTMVGLLQFDGHARFNDNEECRFGTGTDWKFFSNGNNMFIDQLRSSADDIYIRKVTSTDVAFKFDVSESTLHADGDLVAFSTTVP